MRRLICSLLLCAGCLLPVCAQAQNADAAKVAQVVKGELKEARASWWGFNAEDSTEALKAAINSKVPKLIIDKMPSAWITNTTLFLVSNQEIVFEEGAELLAKKDCFKGTSEALVTIKNVSNVTLRGEGKGALLRMRKADYHTAAYKPAEWRHCVSILSSNNIKILNLTLKESGGDGIYFGVNRTGVFPTDIVVKDVICDGHNRQGISVIAGVNVLVENTKLINTSGTPPAAGIDFEPNKAGEQIRNFVMRNCESYNNSGAGYDFYLGKMNITSGELGITLENCTSKNDARGPYTFTINNGAGVTMPGNVIVRNCVFEDSPNEVRITGTSSKGFKTLFENVVIRNVAQGSDKVAAMKRRPIEIGLRSQCEEPAGNIHFKNVKVIDNVEREPLRFINGGVCGGLENISGVIDVECNGKKSKFEFSNEWALANHKPRNIRVLPLYKLEGKQFEPVMPNAKAPDKDLPKLQQRGTGTYLFYAKKGEDIKFKALFGQLGNYKADTAAVEYKLPSGGKLKNIGSIPFKQQKEFEIKNVPETGLYEVKINAGGNWSRIVRSSNPVVIRTYPSHVSLVSGTGTFFFYVPEGTDAFSLKFNGDGAEGLKATIIAPDEKQLWQMDDISALEYFLDDGEYAHKGGIFKLIIEPPTNLATIEDHFIKIEGIPQFIAPAKEFLLKPVR